VLSTLAGAGSALGAAPDPWRALHGARPPTPVLDRPVTDACRSRVASEPAPLLTRRAQHEARARLLAAARVAAREEQPCLWLLAARRALGLGMTPEAVAEARRAEALAAEAGAAAVAEAARWLRAEALLAAGRADEAEPIYRAVAGAAAPPAAAAPDAARDGAPAAEGEPPAPGGAEAAPAGSVPAAPGRLADGAGPLAVLAALRLAEVALQRGDPHAARAGFAATLAPAAAQGVPIGPFSLRSAEAAAAAGRADEARRQLAEVLRGPLEEPLRAIARLRLAGLLLEEGDEAAAREQLEIARRFDPGAPAGRLAALQLLELDLEAARREGVAHTAVGGLRAAELAERLPDVSAEDPPALAAYARRLAARLAVLAGQPERALDLLPALSGPAAEAAIGEALALLVAPRDAEPDCPFLVSLLVPRAGWLLRRAPEPEPLATLARCQSRLLGPAAAIDLQRAIVRRFGARGRAAVAVDLAEGLLATGALDAVAAAANERVPAGGVETATWRRLRAEVELARGAAGAAAAQVAPILEADDLPRDLQLAALDVLVRAAHAAPRDVDVAERLAAAVELLGARFGADAGERLGEAALQAAHRIRREGGGARAISPYALAAEALPPGPRRAQALYWSGVLAGGEEARRRALEASAGEPGGGEWSALARRRLAVAALRRVSVRRDG
jgi:hypothetical protein